MNTYQQFSETIILSPDNVEAKKAWVTQVLSLNEQSVTEELFPEDANGDRFNYDYDKVTREHHIRLAALIGEDTAEEMGDTLDCWPGFQWEIEQTCEDGPVVLSLTADESFDLNHLITFVQSYLRKFDPKAVFRVTWANWSSRMEPGAFSGGYAVISAEKYVTGFACDDAEELAVEMAKEIRGHVFGILNSAEISGMAQDIATNPDVTPTWLRDHTEGLLFLDAINNVQVPPGYENIYRSFLDLKDPILMGKADYAEIERRVEEHLESIRKNNIQVDAGYANRLRAQLAKVKNRLPHGDPGVCKTDAVLEALANRPLKPGEVQHYAIVRTTDGVETVPLTTEQAMEFKGEVRRYQPPRLNDSFVQDLWNRAKDEIMTRLVRGFQKTGKFSTPAENAVNEYLEAHKNEGETTGDVRARLDRENTWTMTIDRIAECECDGDTFPGILLPASHDDNTDYAWVQRCDQCSLFSSDDHAAFFVARKLGLEVGYAKFNDDFSPRPYLKDITFNEAVELARKLRKW